MLKLIHRKKILIGKRCLAVFLILQYLLVFTGSLELYLGLRANPRKNKPAPVLNIARPNASGVSLNRLQDFNVGREGLVINNKTGNGNSQLLGNLNGNANFGGKAARIILTEVIGGRRSKLAGKTEIFGQKAEFILTNPYGITCDDCSFSNTSRITLSTGESVLDAKGAISHFNVQGGDVLIEGGGLDASETDFFDVVSQTLKIDAKVKTKDLSMMLGNNQVSYTERSVVNRISGDNHNDYVLDVTALGGVDSDKIQMVGTGKNVGVRIDGKMAASAGALRMTADGKMVFGKGSQLQSKDSKAGISLYSRRGGIENRGHVTSEGNIQISAYGSLQNVGAKLDAEVDIFLTSREKIENKEKTIIKSKSRILLSAKRDILNDGAKILGSDLIDITSERGNIQNTNTVLNANSGAGLIHLGAGRKIINSLNTEIEGMRSVRILSQGGLENINSSIVGVRNLKIHAGGNVVSKGEDSIIGSLGNVNLQASENFMAEMSSLFSRKNLFVKAGSDIQNISANFIADASLFLQAGNNISNMGGGIFSNHSIYISAQSGDVFNDGQITVGGVDIDAYLPDAYQENDIEEETEETEEVEKKITIIAGGKIENIGAKITADEVALISKGGGIANISTNIFAKDKLLLSTSLQKLGSTEAILASSDIKNIDSKLEAEKIFLYSANSILSQNSSIGAENTKEIALIADQDIEIGSSAIKGNRVSLQAKKNINLNYTELGDKNASEINLLAGGNLQASSSSLLAEGILAQASKDLLVDGNSYIDALGEDGLSLLAGRNAYLSGKLKSVGDLSVVAEKSLFLTPSAYIETKADENQKGENGDIIFIAGESLFLGGDVTSSSAMSFQARDIYANTVNLSTQGGDFAILAQNDFILENTLIGSQEELIVSVGSSLQVKNQSRFVASDGNLQISSKDIDISNSTFEGKNLKLQAFGNLRLEASDVLLSDDSNLSIYAGSSLYLSDVNTLNLVNGKETSLGDVRIYAASDLSMENSNFFGSDESMVSIFSGGNLQADKINISGKETDIESLRDTSLVVSSISSVDSARITAGSNLDIGQVNLSGERISLDAGKNLVAQETVFNAGTVIDLHSDRSMYIDGVSMEASKKIMINSGLDLFAKNISVEGLEEGELIAFSKRNTDFSSANVTAQDLRLRSEGYLLLNGAKLSNNNDQKSSIDIFSGKFLDLNGAELQGSSISIESQYDLFADNVSFVADENLSLVSGGRLSANFANIQGEARVALQSRQSMSLNNLIGRGDSFKINSSSAISANSSDIVSNKGNILVSSGDTLSLLNQSSLEAKGRLQIHSTGGVLADTAELSALGKNLVIVAGTGIRSHYATFAGSGVSIEVGEDWEAKGVNLQSAVKDESGEIITKKDIYITAENIILDSDLSKEMTTNLVANNIFLSAENTISLREATIKGDQDLNLYAGNLLNIEGSNLSNASFVSLHSANAILADNVKINNIGDDIRIYSQGNTSLENSTISGNKLSLKSNADLNFDNSNFTVSSDRLLSIYSGANLSMNDSNINGNGEIDIYATQDFYGKNASYTLAQGKDINLQARNNLDIENFGLSEGVGNVTIQAGRNLRANSKDGIRLSQGANLQYIAGGNIAIGNTAIYADIVKLEAKGNLIASNTSFYSSGGEMESMKLFLTSGRDLDIHSALLSGDVVIDAGEDILGHNANLSVKSLLASAGGNLELSADVKNEATTNLSKLKLKAGDNLSFSNRNFNVNQKDDLIIKADNSIDISSTYLKSSSGLYVEAGASLNAQSAHLEHSSKDTFQILARGSMNLDAAKLVGVGSDVDVYSGGDLVATDLEFRNSNSGDIQFTGAGKLVLDNVSIKANSLLLYSGGDLSAKNFTFHSSDEDNLTIYAGANMNISSSDFLASSSDIFSRGKLIGRDTSFFSTNQENGSLKIYSNKDMAIDNAIIDSSIVDIDSASSLSASFVNINGTKEISIAAKETLTLDNASLLESKNINIFSASSLSAINAIFNTTEEGFLSIHSQGSMNINSASIVGKNINVKASGDLFAEELAMQVGKDGGFSIFSGRDLKISLKEEANFSNSSVKIEAKRDLLAKDLKVNRTENGSLTILGGRDIDIANAILTGDGTFISANRDLIGENLQLYTIEGKGKAFLNIKAGGDLALGSANLLSNYINLKGANVDLANTILGDEDTDTFLSIDSEGVLILTNSKYKIESLNLKAKGDVQAEGLTLILKDKGRQNIDISGSADFRNSNVDTSSLNLVVGGNLNLQNSNLSFLSLDKGSSIHSYANINLNNSTISKFLNELSIEAGSNLIAKNVRMGDDPDFLVGNLQTRSGGDTYLNNLKQNIESFQIIAGRDVYAEGSTMNVDKEHMSTIVAKRDVNIDNSNVTVGVLSISAGNNLSYEGTKFTSLATGDVARSLLGVSEEDQDLKTIQLSAGFSISDTDAILQSSASASVESKYESLSLTGEYKSTNEEASFFATAQGNLDVSANILFKASILTSHGANSIISITEDASLTGRVFLDSGGKAIIEKASIIDNLDELNIKQSVSVKTSDLGGVLKETGKVSLESVYGDIHDEANHLDNIKSVAFIAKRGTLYGKDLDKEHLTVDLAYLNDDIRLRGSESFSLSLNRSFSIEKELEKGFFDLLGTKNLTLESKKGLYYKL